MRHSIFLEEDNHLLGEKIFREKRSQQSDTTEKRVNHLYLSLFEVLLITKALTSKLSPG
jgi:hypothetical protein